MGDVGAYKMQSGCKYHKNCFDCPYDDCILEEWRAVKGQGKRGGANNKQPVLMIDQYGNVVKRFEMVKDLSEYRGVKVSTATARMNRSYVWEQDGYRFVKEIDRGRI